MLKVQRSKFKVHACLLLFQRKHGSKFKSSLLQLQESRVQDLLSVALAKEVSEATLCCSLRHHDYLASA